VGEPAECRAAVKRSTWDGALALLDEILALYIGLTEGLAIVRVPIA
jgi:hypothetical protein